MFMSARQTSGLEKCKDKKANAAAVAENFEVLFLFYIGNK